MKDLFTVMGQNSKSRAGTITLLFIITLFILVGCSKSGTGGGDTGGGDTGGGGNTGNCGTVRTFSADVNPVIQSSCATSSGCHGAGSNSGPGPLLSYQQIFNVRSTIRSEVSSGRMPPNGGLSAAQKSAILCWIDNGAPNN